MTIATETEYEDLLLKSSNLMLYGDSRKALGRYEETALCYRRAGKLRQSMAEMKLQADEFEFAAQDWLSAAACFVEGTEPFIARDLVLKVRELRDDQKIPNERKDVFAALHDREQQVARLGQEILTFEKNYDVRGNLKVGTTQDSLTVLLALRRNLPGYWRLHWAIFHQATNSKNETLAFEHLQWASRFDPTNAKLAAVVGFAHIKNGNPQRAFEIGNEFLGADHENTAPVRVMMSFALLDFSPPKWTEANDILRPLLNETDVNPNLKALALGQSAAVHHLLGQRKDYRQLMDQLTELGKQEKAASVNAVIEGLEKLQLDNNHENGETFQRCVSREYLFEQSKLMIDEDALLKA